MAVNLLHKSLYYTFGMVMPERSYASGDGYRFGFQGQEKDDEVAGEGNSYMAEFWQYDPRLSRRWNVDPKPRVDLSVYACFADNPILFSDPYGDTVSYEKGLNGFNERAHVAFSKLTSKGFRDEFKSLKESTNTYKIVNTKGESGFTGGLKRQYENGSFSDNKFVLYYSTKEISKGAPEGKSPLHGLFEEVFHASEYESNFGGIGLKPSGLGWQSRIENIKGEARAWAFAANEAPFAKTHGYFDITIENKIVKVYTSETLIARIRKSENMHDVAALLYTPNTYIVNVREGKHAGRDVNYVRDPLY